MAEHGAGGATIAATAAEAGVAPALVHHHFESKDDLVAELLRQLVGRFQQRLADREGAGADPLSAYIDAALKLDGRADAVAAKCWVGVLSEAIRNPSLFRRVRSFIDTEIEAIQRREPALSSHDAGAVLAFIFGALVMGAFAPRKTAGFAADSLHRMVLGLRPQG